MTTFKKLRLIPLALLVLGLLHKAAIAQSTSDNGVAYSLVYLIHGDSDYLFHTMEGETRQADDHVLQEARSIGKQAKHGEVLIFHQRPERRILWIFPRKDRRFLHYRNGELVQDQRYSPQPDSSQNPFTAETSLYRRYHYADGEDSPFRSLLYFGHEIPIGTYRGYHNSRPDIVFNRKRFVQGVEAFSNSKKFDLTVLSTCENGTPSMVSRLKPYTQNLLASPQNLHLSHIDTRKFLMLEEEPNISPDSLSIALAEDTYKHLKNSIQTVISLSSYKMNQVNGYIDELSDRYTLFHTEQDTADTSGKYIDCAELPFFKKRQYTEGVTTYYRPPQFGTDGDKESHSGWGCRVVEE